MGSFFTDILSFQHETAVFDVNPHQLRFVYNTYRFTTLEEIKEFEPELVINAATVKYTLGRCPHYRQSFCRTGNSRCPERRGYSGIGKEPRKSGSGIMDRRHGAHQ